MSTQAEPVPQYKFFVGCVDTLVGQAIVEQVRNDHLNDVNPHIILGTKSPKLIGPIPSSVKQVINNSDPKLLAKTLVDSDIIIYDLSSAPLDEVEYAIKVLKMANYESEKYLILISSVMSWSSTPPKEKPTEEGAEDIIINQQEGSIEGNQSQIVEEDPQKNRLAYREEEYARRKPTTRYEIFKTLETLCINAGNSRKNLLSYVLCSGIQYGNGEDVFANYFKQAFLMSPDSLGYIGEGQNSIPTIHVRDLAMFVHFVINKRPSSRYIFAIDHTQNTSYKSLVTGISTGLGTGKTHSVSVLDFLKDPYLDIFRLDIKMQPTRVVELMEEEENDKSEYSENDFDSLGAPKFKFEWWCKEGLRKNMPKLVEEYKAYRGLKPLKIFLTGPPAAGKTHIGDILSKNYNLPHIIIAQVIKEIQGLQNDFGEEIRNKLAEIKKKMIEDAEAALEEWKKKKKKGVPEPVVDPDRLIPRLSDGDLVRVYKYRLEQNDCITRGYVLDGFPKTYEQAKAIFLTTPPPTEGAGLTESAVNAPVLDEKKKPGFVVKIEAGDEFLKTRVKGLPEEKTAGTHHTEEGMTRRLPIYHKNNVGDGVQPVLLSFFEENNCEVLKVKGETHSEEELSENIKGLIAQKETFKKFLDQNEIDEMRRKRKQREEQEAEQQRQEQEIREQEARENEEKRLQEEKARIALDILKEQEKTLLDERSQPLRQYLADMVVPFLTSGIIEICKEKPEDPVDFLIEYLNKKSTEPKATETTNPIAN